MTAASAEERHQQRGRRPARCLLTNTTIIRERERRKE